MASSINAANPVTGAPTTASVRANFSAAKSEIEALQDAQALKAPLAGPTFTGTVTAATLNTTTFQIGGTTLTATPTVLNALDGRVTALEGAGYLTGNQTVTLSGDVSGSGTTAITVTVADDSHNHIISNVDGLQTALDAKAVTDGAESFSSITLGTWTISDSAGKLIFDNGSTRFSISAAGAIIAGGDITAFGTP